MTLKLPPRLAGLIVVLLVLLGPLVHGHARSATVSKLPVEVREGNVVVRAEKGLDSYAANVARIASAKYGPIRADLSGLPEPDRIEIRLVREAADMQSVAPSQARVPEWAAGVAFRGTGVVVVALRRNGQPLGYENTTAHELAHLVLDAALGKNVPRWLHEGFAFLHSSDLSLERTRALIGMAWTGGGYSLADLDNHFPERKISAHRAYAQAFDVVAFLSRRGRFSSRDDDGNRLAFRKFLRSLAAGMTVNQASLEAYSASLSALEAEWRTHLRGRLMIAPVGTCSLGVWGFGAVLLIAGFIRKRYLNRITLQRWADEDEERALRVAELELARAGAEATTIPPTLH